MITRTISFAAVCVAALSPALANATPEKTSAQACASAFASSMATHGTEAQPYKFAYRGGSTASVVNFYPSDFTFTMIARDPKTGATIARAQCTADSRGSVTGLAALPLDTKTATLASAF